MKWMNEPPAWGTEKEYLWVETAPSTDLFQKTYYQFQRDNAHAYLREVSGNFTLSARFSFYPKQQYDQCGLLIRQDEHTWLKCSVEYEEKGDDKLGSVLTSFGYSDWATQDISSEINEMWYRLEMINGDVILTYSLDGTLYRQMRICHFHADGEKPVYAGIYGCSPEGKGFRFEVSELSITGRE